MGSTKWPSHLKKKKKKKLALKLRVILLWHTNEDTPVELLLPYSASTINIVC